MDSYKNKLELYRKRILDTSKRNSLISFKHTDRSISQIRFIDEIPDYIHDKLDSDKELIIQSIKDPNEPPPEETKPDFITLLAKEKSRNQKYLEAISIEETDQKLIIQIEFEMINKIRRHFGYGARHLKENIAIKDVADSLGINTNFDLNYGFKNELITKRHSDNKLQTLFFKKDLNEKVKKLYKKVDSIKKETGINSLFIIYGFLEWEDESDKNKKIYSPLLAQEVEITQKILRNEIVYSIKVIEEDPIINPALNLRIKEDYKIYFPEFSNGVKIEEYHSKIREIIKHKYNWKVRNFLTLSILAYSKSLIYKDLDPEILENKEEEDYSLLLNFLDKNIIQNDIVEEFNPDSLLKGNNLPLLITDADSSQFEAIDYVVNKGNSTVIQGPPGTGKSQTISNIISASISNGKRVLFLSEKLAALTVVKNRLDKANIGDFCLELHSNKINKSEIFKTIKKRYELKQNKDSIDRDEHFRKFCHTISKLNSYYNLIKKSYFELDKSLSDLIWNALNISEEIKYNIFEDSFIEIPLCKQITLNELENLKKELIRFKRYCIDLISLYGSYKNHNWKDFDLGINNGDSQKDVNQLLIELIKKNRNISKKIKEISYVDLSNKKISYIKKAYDLLKETFSNWKKTDILFLKYINDPQILRNVKTLKNLVEDKFQLSLESQKFFRTKLNNSLGVVLEADISTLINENFNRLNLNEVSTIIKFINKLPDNDILDFDFSQSDINETSIAISNLNNSEIKKSIILIIEQYNCKTELTKFLSPYKLNNLCSEDLQFINSENTKYKNAFELDQSLMEKRINFLENEQEYYSKLSILFSEYENQLKISKDKINLSLLNDLTELKAILNNFPDSAKHIPKRNYSNNDLNILKNYKRECEELKIQIIEIQKKLNVSLLDRISLEEVYSTIINIKKKNFYSILTKQYWKNIEFKKVYSVEKLKLTEFNILLEQYYNYRKREINLLNDNSIKELIPGINDLLKFDFEPYIDLATWSSELSVFNFKNQLSKKLSSESNNSDNERFLNIRNCLNCVAQNDIEKIINDLQITNFPDLLKLENNIENELIFVSKTLKLFEKYDFTTNTTIYDCIKISELYKKNQTNQKIIIKNLILLKEIKNKINTSLNHLLEMVQDKYIKIEELNIFITKYLKNYKEINDSIYINILEPIKNLDELEREDIIYLSNAVAFNESIKKLNSFPEICNYIKNTEFENKIINLVEDFEFIYNLLKENIEVFMELESKKIFSFHKVFNYKNEYEIPIIDIINKCDWIESNLKYLSLWKDFQISCNLLASKGLQPYLYFFETLKYNIENLEKYFELFVYISIISEIENIDVDSIKFLTNTFQWESLRNEFQNLDKEHLSLNQSKLRNNLISNKDKLFSLFMSEYSNYKSYSKSASDRTGEDLIFHEINKSRRHISIRDLFNRAGHEVTAYCPCLMMSPLTVAQYLPLNSVKFDLLVIDEASQLRPEYCLSAILRSNQIVVVGDDNQLPPTSFFDRSIDDSTEIIDDEIFENEILEDSILELSNSIFKNKKSLNWHYRSKHESLIQFSNIEFYDSSLVIFPSPKFDNELGVKYNFVEDGVYVPNIRKNFKEAEVIAKKIIELISNDSKDTFGVVTMNDSQRELIEKEIDKLIELSGNNELYEKLYNNNSEEFFVKNLENVQGDERDIIIVSTVYGKDKDGKFNHRFGPINSINGHKRLNVLFTRARKQLLLYTSMKPEYIDEKGRKRGVKVLKKYLEYARDGIYQTAQSSNREADSEFEIAVKRFLTSHGFEVESQIGVNGFFVDLGVKSKNSNTYMAGIECDGAPYHSSKSARDRDRLRQEILESLGWKIYRIWSTDWYRDYDREKLKLLNYLKML